MTFCCLFLLDKIWLYLVRIAFVAVGYCAGFGMFCFIMLFAVGCVLWVWFWWLLVIVIAFLDLFGLGGMYCVCLLLFVGGIGLCLLVYI